jgi:hypothetical protein
MAALEIVDDRAGDIDLDRLPHTLSAVAQAVSACGWSARAQALKS